jgi:phosphatidylinositol alpha-1,6-mannosyltransferase
MRRVFHSAGALLANSRNTASMMAAMGAPESRIRVVHPGVDPERYHPGAAGAAALRARLAPSDEVLLLTVGRFQRRKGHDTALRALARIDRGAVPVRYAIVGDGDERGSLQRLAHDLGITGRVTFEGVVPAAALPSYYAAADIFIHPNRVENGDLEGFGIVFLEAAAAGLAVIAGRSGGVPEAVVDGVTGVLISGTDVDELVTAIVALGREPDQRRTMGAAGRERVMREFTWDRAAEKVRAVHEQVAAEGRLS